MLAAIRASLTATGPLLAAAGVPAVVAMHGTVNMETVARFMPIFFRELERHGQIDWAMATARSQVRSQPDWWAPVLFMRLRSGRLWIDEIGLAGGTSPTPAQPAVPSPVAIQLLPSQRRHLETRKSEIEASYATLSRRMVALDTDFSRELDSERKLTLEERRAELSAERDRQVEELEDIERQLMAAVRPSRATQ